MAKLDERVVDQHEAYAIATITRAQCNPAVNLFGSGIKHSTYISLQISRAERHRNLARDTYYPTEDIIRIAMSQQQFAQMVTSAGIGNGTPVTIQRLNNESMEPIPHDSVREKFSEDFSSTLNELKSMLTSLQEQAENVLKKSTSKKAERESLSKEIERVSRCLHSSIPFITDQFNRSTQHIIDDAKQEVESYIQHRTVSLGGIAGDTPSMLSDEGSAQNDSD